MNDSSVTFKRESSNALGTGYRCGFLGNNFCVALKVKLFMKLEFSAGMLHMDVFTQRLEQEYGANVIATSATVPYKIILKDGEEITIDNPANFPDTAKIVDTLEPFVKASIITPETYLGNISKLCLNRRAVQIDRQNAGDNRILVVYEMPLAEIISNFFDRLKALSQGYATLDYTEIGFRSSNIVKMDIQLNGEKCDALSVLVHRNSAYTAGKKIVSKLKELIDRQLFEIAIQASVGTKVIAAEKLKAYRKNVTVRITFQFQRDSIFLLTQTHHFFFCEGQMLWRRRDEEEKVA